MTRRKKEILLLFLVLAIIVFGALNSTRFFTRIDMTENQIFSISDVSKEMIADIPETVHITYYLSEKLKKYAPTFDLAADILNEYAASSHGNIQVDIIDPVKAGMSGRAEQLGVQPRQINIQEEDESSFAVVYSGIVIEYLDRYETIPFLSNTETMEYELTSTITELVKNRTSTIGVLIGNDDRRLEEDYQFLKDTLSKGYEVKPINQGTTIPDTLSGLLVIGGRDLDTFDLYPIDQYLMDGGKILFAVDGVPINNRNFQPAETGEMPILDMLSAYGVDIKKKLVLDQNHRVFATNNQGQTRVMPYPHWVELVPKNVSDKSPLTKNFSGLDLFWPSPLEINKKEGLEYTRILSTSEKGYTIEKDFSVYVNPQYSSQLADVAGDERNQYDLGYTVTGSFPSYFAEKEIPTREGEVREWESITKTSKKTRAAVIGDSDFPSNLIQFSMSKNILNRSMSKYNVQFAETCADWLSKDNRLMQIKNRQVRDMRLNKIQDPGVKQFTMLFVIVLNIVIVPLAVIVFGIIRYMRRRNIEASAGGEE